VSGEKTEKATPKQQEKARKEGNIPKTPELTGWAQILAAVYMVQALIKGGSGLIGGLVTEMSLAMAGPPDPAVALRLMGDGLKGMVLVLLPVAATMAGIGVVGQIAQVGLHLNLGMLKPKPNRLNPMSGIKKLFSPTTYWEGGKTIIKLLVLGELARRAITGALPKLTQAGGLATEDIVSIAAGSSILFVRNVAICGLLLACVDYVIIRRQINKKLKMSKDDVKQEHKSTEGNPLIKGQIKGKQLAMSRMRMMAEIPNADFVVTNPTRLALAVTYNPVQGAPKVVAKGSGAVADRIRKEASRNRVAIIEDKPLARTLYRVCEIGDEIPAELYEAVARVLAFVFGLKKRGSAAGFHKAASGMAEEMLDLQKQKRRRARA
jgi:flagellar biosynthetic protein FlhB